MALNLIKDIRN